MPFDPAASTAPNFRATIALRRVTLVIWGPWLAAGVQLPALLRQRGDHDSMLADLSVLEDDRGIARELVVDVLSGDSPEARYSLLRWATAAGYERVWLPDDVVEIGDDSLIGGLARTRCRTCGARFESASADFWVVVRCSGAFPVTCSLCGADLPQATVRRRAGFRGPVTRRNATAFADPSRR